MGRMIQWFIENPVASNLMMIIIFLGGAGSLLGINNLNKEVFPTIETQVVQISMSYPGAGPTEVEQQINIRIEEAIADLEGIDEISSEARQGYGVVTAEVLEGYDPDDVVNDIKTSVDSIITFPPNAERPITRKFIARSPLMSLAIHGNVSEKALKQTGVRVRDELSLLPKISYVELHGARDYEMAIEISEQDLRRYNLTFDQVSAAIKGSSLNLPAGMIRSDQGDIQVQTRSQAYTAADFENIVVRANPDGSKIYVRDVALVKDGFTELDSRTRFNGERAVFLELSVSDKPDVLASTKEVKAYLAKSKDFLPEGVTISVWRDWSKLFKGRLNLLMSNAFTGLLLVFIVLMLFLRPLLAAWVCVGIAISFMGAFWVLPYVGASINMISLFSFIMVLGIVVDDAIIVGESIYTRQQGGMKNNSAAVTGAKLVAKPVFFAVISTIIFFAPMLFIPGPMGKMSYPIPMVVILCLFFSLFECMYILPNHLAHMKPEQESRFEILNQFARFRKIFSDGMSRFIENVYAPKLHNILHHSFATVIAFLLAFFLSISLYATGWMKSSFMPNVASDYVAASAKMPEGSAFSETQEIVDRFERAAEKLRTDDVMLEINGTGDFIEHVRTYVSGINIKVDLALVDAELREVSTPEVQKRWRELIGEVPEAEEYRLDYTINSRGEAFRLNLTIGSNKREDQERAAKMVSDALASYPGVFDVKDSLQAARDEVSLSLKPHAETLGIRLSDVARQVRQAFYGDEVQRIPLGEEDVKVLVRYPKDERSRLDQLNDMRVRTSAGVEVPLEEVANIELVPGYTTIKRMYRKRVIIVTADMTPGEDPNAIVSDMMHRNMASWKKEFPGFSLAPDGNMKNQMEFMTAILKSFIIALLVIYILMAMAFGSYGKPILVLTAVPFGFMGAVIGHIIMGREVSMLSILGFVACAGVVVNDNLVLLDRIMQLRHQGKSVYNAVFQAGKDRFRPIILTSITTFVGLMPIMFEQSVQARFLVPMVISLSFGVMFATLVTLLLVPALYLLGARMVGRELGLEPEPKPYSGTVAET